MGTQYKSLLGLTEVIADSAEISNIDLEATNITGLTTSRIPEGYNLYYTDARVSENPNVSSNTTHRERKDNPHGVTAAQVGIEDTDDIIEGHNNLYYTDIRFDDRLATKTTTSLAEGSNLYYTDARFDTRFGIKTTTDLTEGTNLYYTDARFDARFGIKTTTDLTEGANLYYTDVRFDNRLLSKTTTDLTEGANLYYTTTRANADFDTRFGIKTTDDLTEGKNNIYYTDARFDTRLATKTTTNLTEGTNLYYTDARFDARLATKTTDDLTEGANLYYTTTRANADFDTRLATKSTTNLTEGSNLYYTEARVSANTDVKANTAYRNTGHLPLSGGTLTGNLNMGNRDIDNVNQIFVDRKGLANNKLVLYDGGSGSTTSFYGLGIQNSTLLYNVDGSGANHRFYYAGTNEVFRIGNAGVFSYRNLSVTGNISLSGTVDGVDVAALNTAANNHIENTNNPHAVLATQIADFDTEVSANVDVKANTAYRNTGHLPLAGGTLTGNINMGNNKIITLAAPTADADAANKKYIDDKFRLYEEGKVLAERYSITTYANNTAEMNARFNGKTPNASQYLTNLYTVGWSGEQFGVIYNCYLYVPTDGNVTFRVRSDDSSDWFIDNALVASNYGGHGVGGEPVVTSTVFMTAGFHKSFSRFIEQSGGEGIIHDWDLKGGSNFTTIPTANIFIPKLGLSDITDIGSGAIITTTERADIKTNSEYAAIGHLPLTGGTLTGDLSIDGELNIGGEKITTAATNGLQLYGPSNDIGGPHIQAFVSTDNYPVFQQLNNSHGSIAMCFDAYADGFTWKSSSSGTNAIIYKSNTDLEFSYSSGVAAGGEVIWNAGFSMDLANGLVSFSNGLDVTGDLSISGTVDGVNLPALETDVKANTAYRNTGHLPLAGGSLAGDLTWDIAIELPTWTSNTVYTPSDDPNWSISSSSVLTSTYQAFKAFNKTVLETADCWASANGKYNSDGTVKSSTYTTTQVDGSNSYQGEWIQIRHTDKKLRLTSFILTTRLTYPEYSKYYRLLGTNDDPTGSPNWTTLMYNTTQLEWSGPGASLVLTPDGVLGYYNTYRLLITQCSVSLCSIGRFIPSFTVAEGTVIDGKSINGTDIDTLISDVKANTAKVSASGSISTHNDVNLNLLKDYEVLTYFSGEWKNMATQTPDTSAFLLANGTRAMTGNLNMGNQDIDNVNQIFVDRKAAANNKIVLYDGGTPSTTAFYGFGLQSATLLYNVDASHANHKFYYGGTNELFRIGNAAVYSYRDLDVKGNITVSGTVDGVDVAALKTAVDGCLPLSGGTMTGDLKLEVSRPTGGWASYFKYTGGTVNGRTYGFLLDANSFYLTAHNDDYSYSHPIMRFDHDGYCYAMKNFSAGTYRVVDVGAPVGGMDATNLNYVENAVGGRLSLNGGTMRGNIDMGGYNINTVGTVDGYNLDTLNTNINSKLPLTGGTMSGNIDMGGYNINTVGTVDGYNLDTLNTNINSKFPLSGGTVSGGTTFNSGVTFNQSITMNTNKQIFWKDATAEHCGLKWLDNNHVFYCRRWANEMILDEWGRFNIRIAHYDKGWATGSGWFTSSDYNMKKNIRDISTCALDTINLLKPQCYILKDDGTENTTCGLIAQDVKKLVDEKKICFNPVNEINYEHDPDRENIMGLDYNSFIGLLIKGVQELSAEVNTLKNRIELLESPIV